MKDKSQGLDQKFFIVNTWIPHFLKSESYKRKFHEALEKMIESRKKSTFIHTKKLLDQLIPIYINFLRDFSLFNELSGEELLGIYFYIIRISLRQVLDVSLPLEHEFFLLHDIHEILFGGK